MLLENATKYEQAIRTAGQRAMQQAKRAGAPVYYMDPAISDGIIRELPDGTRQVVAIGEGEDIVIKTLGVASRP